MLDWKKLLVTVLAITIPFLLLLPLLEDYARHNLTQSDIRQIYKEGLRIRDHDNPYARIVEQPMGDNDYPTYLPGFYLLAAATKNIAGQSFQDWLTFWRAVFFACHLGIGWVIFFRLWRHNSLTLGVVGASFWWFNRWSLMVLRIAHLEPLAILLLVLSLVIMRRHFMLACLLFGASLAVKQIAVFMLPVYLLWAWRLDDDPRRRVKNTIIAATCCLAIPILTSWYFMAQNPWGFVRSLLYSVTRKGEANVGNSGDFEIPSIDMLLRFDDRLENTIIAPFRRVIAKVFLFGLMALSYRLAYRRQLRPFALSLIILAVFCDFHSVFFPQYVVWPLAILPFVLGETGTSAKREWKRHRQRGNKRLAMDASPQPTPA
ncbi:MAG: hypothetical protein ABI579_07030 [Candidatus Sumerlaeota bacterium]